MNTSNLQKLRIIWAFSGMHLNTGYRKVTRNDVTRLAARELDIICFNLHIYGTASDPH